MIFLENKGDEVIPGTYRHYKGNDYEVMGIATNRQTMKEDIVVLRALQDSGEFKKGSLCYCVRERFFQKIPVSGGREVARFVRIG